jgi:hypothetical protein
VTASSPAGVPAASDVSTDAAIDVSTAARLAAILREIARGGLAGLVGGVLVGGLGGRVAMLVAARLNPDATGRLTENGEVVGAFTLNGTLSLLLFGGVFAGIAAGVVWVVLSPWIPGHGWRRWLLTAPIGISLGGFMLVRAGNTDFVVLDLDSAIVAMLLVLVALVAGAVAFFDDLLERRLPAADSRRWGTLAYGLVAAVGLLFLPVVAGLYLTDDGCGCGSPPVLVGWLLLSVGLVTLAWWGRRVRSGRVDRPLALVIAGRAGLAASAALGFAFLVPIVAEIVGRS